MLNVLNNYGTNAVLENVKDDMSRTGHLSQVLLGHNIPRVTFDPTVKEHRAAYLSFMETGVWLIKFKLESPHQSITQLCERRILTWALRNDVKASKRLWKKNRSQD